MELTNTSLAVAKAAAAELARLLKFNPAPDNLYSLAALPAARHVIPPSCHTLSSDRSKLGLMVRIGDLVLVQASLKKLLTDAGETADPVDDESESSRERDARIKFPAPEPAQAPGKPSEAAVPSPPVRGPLPRGAHSYWDLVTPQAVARAERREVGVSYGSKSPESPVLKVLTNNRTFFRYRVSMAAIRKVQALEAKFPNFAPVISAIVDDLSLRRVCDQYLRMEPLLIVGPPGIGKTVFAHAMATAMGFHMEVRTFAEMTAGFLLTGNSRRWNGSGPGLIADLLAHLPAGKMPLLLFDELDKARDSNYPPTRPLISLLEEATAQRFVDEYLELEMDLRPMSYLFTANALSPIPDYLLSRLKVIHVASPTREQMPAIVRSVDADIRRTYRRMPQAFAPLDQEILDKLGALAPRRLSLLLRAVYAAAARSKPDLRTRNRRVTLADLKTARSFLLPGE